MVYDLLRALPGEPGFFATIACWIIANRLDASVGASGPHGFAVRGNPASPNGFAGESVARLATLPRPPHPAPKFGDDRPNAPLLMGAGRANQCI
jgi:hypothetical protein